MMILRADTEKLPDKEAAQFNAVWPLKLVIVCIAYATAKLLVHIDVTSDF